MHPGPSDVGRSAREWLDQYFEEVNRTDRMLLVFNFSPTSLEAGKAILALSREEQAAFVLEAIDRQVALINDPNTCGSSELSSLLGALLRKKLLFSEAHLERLLLSIGQVSRSGWWSAVSPLGILRAVEEHIATAGLSEPLRAALTDLAARLREHRYYAEPREVLKRVEDIFEARRKQSAHFELTTDEAWTRRLGATLTALDPAARTAWDTLLTHCATATSAKPSQKWLKLARPLIEAVGDERFVTELMATLAEIGQPGKPPVTYILGNPIEGDPTVVHDTHSDLLRGLVWCASLIPQDALISAVGDAADVCFRKIPGVGPRAPKIGNACLVALSAVSSTVAVAQLSRLKTKTKHVSIQKQLGKAFDTASQKTGMSAQELEEVAVPDCGLTSVGEMRRPLGEYTALIHITEGVKPALSWLKPDGKTQASVPAAVREQFPAEVKSLKLAEKEVGKLLPAQRDRLEQLFLQQRSWALGTFRPRFLDHLLVGFVARRLIWNFDDRPGIWHDGRIVDETGQALDGLSDETRVSIWHPHATRPERVQAWRDWLENHEVRQPFKQAHREVYLLTDTERQTALYSTRFAAHVIRQHPFAALCQQRGWRYRLQGAWDSANTPVRDLPEWNLRAEFWVVPLRVEGTSQEGSDLMESPIFLCVSTDQVRFTRPGGGAPIPLDEVPPLVFSEVMRDVDLFLGAASVGNDPRWRDNRLFQRYGDYWQGFAFGALVPGAQTRKEVLERVVPRLKIADRCSFSERFLVVRGKLRTYKIHLGSGNVLMSPNDQFLSIEPKSVAAAEGVYLPFEGDTMLPIILGKALMLAEDGKIKDPAIKQQIQPAPE
jgi:hypothetical protein